jgi:hypothetical protein
MGGKKLEGLIRVNPPLPILENHDPSQAIQPGSIEIPTVWVTIGRDGRCDDDEPDPCERRPRWNPNDWKPLAMAWLVVLAIGVGSWLWWLGAK